MKTALIHDWLVTSGGAEKVLEETLESLSLSDFYIDQWEDPAW